MKLLIFCWGQKKENQNCLQKKEKEDFNYGQSVDQSIEAWLQSVIQAA